jgi:hypothetical protein
MTAHDIQAKRFEIEGEDLGYPTVFRDGCSATGLFVVRSGAAQELIAESGFEIAEIAPRRGLMALTAVHYTDTDCGRYDEIAQAFFVRPVARSPSVPYLGTWLDLARGNVASFTWKLQVTTRLSQFAGIEMWGFPKTLEEIEFDRSDERARFSLRMDGQDVLNFSVRAEGSQTPSPITSKVYSIFEGAPHVSYLTQSYRDTGVRLGKGLLELGPHPLAQQLRELGLPRRPLISTWNGHLAFSMTAPEKL